VLAARAFGTPRKILGRADVAIGHDGDADGCSRASNGVPIGLASVELRSGSSVHGQPRGSAPFDGLRDANGLRGVGPSDPHFGRHRDRGGNCRTDGRNDLGHAIRFPQQGCTTVVSVDPPHGAPEIEIDGRGAAFASVASGLCEQRGIPAEQLQLNRHAGARSATMGHLRASPQQRVDRQGLIAHPRKDADAAIDSPERGEQIANDRVGDAMQRRELQGSRSHERSREDDRMGPRTPASDGAVHMNG